MSHISVKQSSSTGQQPSLEDFFNFGLKLLTMSIDNVRTVMRQSQTFLPAMPSLASLRQPCPCAIPEVECPPRCFCEVTWEAIAGEALALNVRVTNSSRFPRIFYLRATPFAGPGAPPTSVGLTPNTLSLAAGQTGIANATFTVPATTAEGEYYAEIVVRTNAPGGYYERAVCITLKVGCKKTCGEQCCTCSVAMGDAPHRIRAHQWYHHFQCTEQCFISEGDLHDALHDIAPHASHPHDHRQ